MRNQIAAKGDVCGWCWWFQIATVHKDFDHNDQHCYQVTSCYNKWCNQWLGLSWLSWRVWVWSPVSDLQLEALLDIGGRFMWYQKIIIITLLTNSIIYSGEDDVDNGLKVSSKLDRITALLDMVASTYVPSFSFDAQKASGGDCCYNLSTA